MSASAAITPIARDRAASVGVVAWHVAGVSKDVAKLADRFPMAEFELALSLLFEPLVAGAPHPAFDLSAAVQQHDSRSATRQRSLRTWMRLASAIATHRLISLRCLAARTATTSPTRRASTRISAPTTDYWRWIDALRARGMGHVLDLVPNHMGIAQSANPWWQDVLENGPSSRFARFFDIEWHPVKDELADKVLIPILGDPVRRRARGGRSCSCVYRDGAFVVSTTTTACPIAPDTYWDDSARRNSDAWLRIHAGDARRRVAEHPDRRASTCRRAARAIAEAIALRAREKEVVKRRLAALAAGSPQACAMLIDAMRARASTASPGSRARFDRLDRLLNAQSYPARALARRVGRDQLPPVLRRQPARGAADGRSGGLRRGAPLRARSWSGAAPPPACASITSTACSRPADYLPSRAAARVARPTPQTAIASTSSSKRSSARTRQLSGEWPVHGTTGYEFAAVVNNLFVDRRNERALDDIYKRFIRDRARRGGSSFDELAYRSKKQVLHETMSGDINSLGHQLNRFSERNRHFRDFTLYSLISTIKEVIACFPVYRTYVDADADQP